MKRHTFLNMVVVAFLFILMTGPVQAQSQAKAASTHTASLVTKNLYATEDSYVDQGFPNAETLNSDHLRIGWGEFGESFLLLRFDVSSIPKGARVSVAQLFLYQFFSSDTVNRRLWVFWVEGPWHEDTVNWNNKPLTEKSTHSALVSNNIAAYRAWYISEMVQCWVNRSDQCTETSLAVRDNVSFSEQYYRSFESSEAVRRPYIQVTYEPYKYLWLPVISSPAFGPEIP